MLLVLRGLFGMRAGRFLGREGSFFARRIDEVDTQADAEQSQGVIPSEESLVQEEAGEHSSENGSEEIIDDDFPAEL